MADQFLHFPHGSFQPDEHGPGDDGVADVQLVHVRDARDGNDIVIVQPMTRMQVHSQITINFPAFVSATSC